MPEHPENLQQRMEQLPDADPPYGLDTRIKAQARAHLEHGRNRRAKYKYWGAGLATASCAVLALVTGKQLLQQPPPQLMEQESQGQFDPLSADTVRLNSARPAPSAMPARESVAPPRKQSDSDGGQSGAPLKMQKTEAAKQLYRSFAAPAAVMELSTDSKQNLSETLDQKVPLATLQEMFEQLDELREQGKSAAAAALIKRIEARFPDYLSRSEKP